MGRDCLNCIFAFAYCVCDLTGSFESVYHAHYVVRAYCLSLSAEEAIQLMVEYMLHNDSHEHG